MGGCHYQVGHGVITRWDVACGGVSLPGRKLLVMGCCYKVGRCLWWGVVTRLDITCGRLLLPCGTGCGYQVGCRLWWGVVTGCHYQVGQGVVTR